MVSNLYPYLGIVIIAAGSGGMVFGGYIVKRFNMQVKDILKLSTCLTAIGMVFCLVLVPNCNNAPFAGVNIDYKYRNER